jgi:hypothetical protein
MSRNDAEAWAQRFYGRVPAHYRVYDADRGQPLLALLRVVAAQAANLRQDLDDLWDNFFIETCDDWVVPYLGALVGTQLLAQPVGQSNRLDVWNTVAWRRSKGTPAMLRSLAGAISGWPADFTEFFQALGWSQNVNHPRLGDPIAPDLRDPRALAHLGHADDPFDHAADFRPAGSLDQARVTKHSLGIGRAGWGTPGRHQIKTLGFFVRRLQTFAVRGSMPAAAAPGVSPAAGAASFTFDPVFCEMPLFVERTAEPLTRAAFDAAPWKPFGIDLAVRQFGVLLASEAEPQADRASSHTPFTFGGRGAGLALDAASGMRLLGPHASVPGGTHFVITAEWRDGGAPTQLGRLSTLLAARGRPGEFLPGVTAPGPGTLAITVESGRPGLGWAGLPPSPVGRFPGGVLAVRAARSGLPRDADGLYVYLPSALIRPGEPQTFHVADDGSTYMTADLAPVALAAESEGQVHPARVPTASTAFADAFTAIRRTAGGLRVADPDRFGAAQVLIRAEIFTGAFNLAGALATINQPGAAYPELEVPALWPAFQDAPSKAALHGQLPEGGPGLLSIHLVPLSGQFLPSSELIVTNRAGRSLLVYLPEVAVAPAVGVWLFVADDGSTYFAPGDDPGREAVLREGSYAGLPLARGAVGQVLPIAGVWPLQQRRPVARNLRGGGRPARLHPGELAIDPELGRFALSPDDPAVGGAGLSVDYIEAFSDRVGARTFDRQIDPAVPATRLVAHSGDADSPLTRALVGAPIHTSVADALAAAQDGDVVEIADSASYAAGAEAVLDAPAVKRLTVRAAPGQRPCLAFYDAGGGPASSSLRVRSSLDELELNGLFVTGGPLRIDAPVAQLRLLACTLDPRPAT